MLSPAEWHDIYELEKENIEYNYDHYFSGDYLRCLERYDHADDRIAGIIKRLN